MHPQSANPVEKCARTAAGVLRYIPCALLTRKALIPRIHRVLEVSPWQRKPTANNPAAKRPLRQRLCRFAFKEFIRSCGLSPRMVHLESFTPWRMALGAGLLGAMVGLILG